MTTSYVPNYGCYSFMDVRATLNGPHAAGLVLGGPQAASAEEGITITLGEETNTQTIGADGSVMNSLHASRAGTCTVRLLKTSPMNKALQEVYNYQRKQSNLWGRNLITVVDVSRLDTYTLEGCAFVRFPTNAYAKVGNTIEWEFHVSVCSADLGGPALDLSMYDIGLEGAIV